MLLRGAGEGGHFRFSRNPSSLPPTHAAHKLAFFSPFFYLLDCTSSLTAYRFVSVRPRRAESKPFLLQTLSFFFCGGHSFVFEAAALFQTTADRWGLTPRGSTAGQVGCRCTPLHQLYVYSICWYLEVDSNI